MSPLLSGRIHVGVMKSTMKSFKLNNTLYYNLLIVVTTIIYSLFYKNVPVDGSQAMKRLYEDLFTDYNRLIIPIAPNKTKVTVIVGLKLGQILDLNLKQQILSTNVWVEQTWHDHRLEWDPSAYGGIDMVHVPAENIWIPDIVLFNNADGNYELTLIAKAVLNSNGMVTWKPPTMFRSTCEIDVEYFPFDIQTCFLRFGSWTYAGDEVDIKHSGAKRKAEVGIDLSQFYKNVEWDIIDVPAYYNEVYYDGRAEPFQDITFKIVIRRKMLFYLVNLILPVALMTFMTVSVFYLPADSNEKVTLSISILTSLIVFFLLMLEVIPPTSLAVPLFGKYLLFTLVLVSLSACVSVYVLNIYHRAPSVHQMSPRMRQVFLKTLPRLLRLDRPDPRERSSLNRFRKKKLAQQILQQSKVYDLAQPLAASLNLIETLQKSYNFNPRDDNQTTGGSKKLKSEHGQEEGRYFRRYVDNYIGKLQAEAAAAPTAETTGSHQHHHNHHHHNQGSKNKSVSSSSGHDHHHSKQSSNSSSSAARNTSAGNGVAPNRCCSEHGRCCPAANKPIRQLSSSSSRRNRITTQSAAPCCGDNGIGVMSAEQQQQTAGASKAESSFDRQRTTSFTMNHAINDDTFDMTFDYDDQDAGVQPVAASESELPSPPPPPRQLAKLSDSMKDLSGRLSSGSQKVAGLNATNLRPLNSRDDHDDDDVEDDDDDDDEGQLVDKLISSINLINNGSDEIDSPTTTTSIDNNNNNNNDDQEYQHFKEMARALNSVPPVPQTRSYPLNMDPTIHRHVCGAHQQSSSLQKCTCNQPPPPPNVGEFAGAAAGMANNVQRNLSHGVAGLNGQMGQQHQCNYRTEVPVAVNQQQQQQPYHGPINSDILAGTNFPNQERPSELLLSLRLPYHQMPDHVRAAIRSILFIADTIKNEDDENSAIEDWESMSMVVDRLFLWIFFLLCTFGSLIILALAPSLYDQRDSIDDKLRIEIPASNCSAFGP